MNKSGIGIAISKAVIYVVCVVLAILSILPFFIMFINATRSTPAIQQSALAIFPGTYLVDNYRHMMGFVYIPYRDEDGNEVISTERVYDRIRVVGEGGQPVLDAQGEVQFDLVPRTDEDGNYIFAPVRHWVREGGRAFNPWLGFRNSLIVSVGVTLLAVYFSSLTAYANVAYEWKLRNALFAFILFVLMVPTQLNIVGFFQFVNQIGWTNSFWPLILPAIASPTIVFFMRQYLVASLSTEIVESARIDGAGEFYTFNRIVLPLMKPALATQAIFVFVGSWNNLLLPMLLLRGDNRTMPVMVQLLRADIYNTVLGAQYLGLAMTILPLFIVYFILSRYIIAGVALGGMKE